MAAISLNLKSCVYCVVCIQIWNEWHHDEEIIEMKFLLYSSKCILYSY